MPIDPWALVGVDASGAGISASLLPLYQQYISQGIPPDVARYMTVQPWTVEGTTRAGGWPTPYRGEQRDEAEMKAQPDVVDQPSWRHPRYQRDVSYQPGGNRMPGMPWDDAGAGAQSPLGDAQNLPPWMRNMNAQQLQAFLALAQSRGTGGMQFGQGGAMMGPRGPVQQAPGMQNLLNQLQGGGQQQGMGQLGPQMLALMQYYQQQQGGQGGGIDLSQLLGGGAR